MKARSFSIKYLPLMVMVNSFSYTQKSIALGNQLANHSPKSRLEVIEIKNDRIEVSQLASAKTNTRFPLLKEDIETILKHQSESNQLSSHFNALLGLSTSHSYDIVHLTNISGAARRAGGGTQSQVYMLHLSDENSQASHLLLKINPYNNRGSIYRQKQADKAISNHIKQNAGVTDSLNFVNSSGSFLISFPNRGFIEVLVFPYIHGHMLDMSNREDLILMGKAFYKTLTADNKIVSSTLWHPDFQSTNIIIGNDKKVYLVDTEETTLTSNVFQNVSDMLSILKNDNQKFVFLLSFIKKFQPNDQINLLKKLLNP